VVLTRKDDIDQITLRQIKHGLASYNNVTVEISTIKAMNYTIF